jgi:hypothetical protein
VLAVPIMAAITYADYSGLQVHYAVSDSAYKYQRSSAEILLIGIH